MPPEVRGRRYYQPSDMGHEAPIRKALEQREAQP